MNNALVKKNDVTDVVPHEEPAIDVATDAGGYARLGWIIVIVGVVGFFLWASFAPLDKGVALSGTVAVSGNRKVIQHQTGGTVDAILVSDGDVVKAGQVLIKMNSVSAKSNAEVSRVQWYTALATESRLKSERDNASAVLFPKELLSAKSDPHVADSIQLQQQLFSARTGALRSEMAAFDENVAGAQIQLKSLEESMQNKKQQISFLKEQLDSLRELSKDGYVARSRLLDLERTYAQVTGAVSEDIGTIGRVGRQVAELKLRKAQRQQEYQREVRSQLSDTQKEAEALLNRLKALDYELKNVDVKSPVDGIVTSLNVFTVGAVVGSGFKLLEVVPADDMLIVEGQLPVHLIDKVHVGLSVDIIFSAFNTNTTPHIPGIVKQVSPDRTVEERTGQPFYKIKVVVAPAGVKMLGNLQIRPGMPADMTVKTGERTMMNYLMKPVLDRVHSSMKEE
ncbi:HlyD family type I secretion periplasmic adaptor subunit [Undibacterium sp. Ji22W]|uniref:HlyD family type I secretion periplasmic adaptor subunit n=1 Tax=Undibacterium sp. Ji22W TaxID=3413038 RepID=UPI003BF1286E